MKKMYKKHFAVLMCLLLVISTLSPVFADPSKTNDYANHWAKDAIASAIQTGITTGYPDGSFKPENPINRAEFFALINNTFQYSATSAAAYVDVTKDAWYHPVISKATAAGYVKGYSDGSIHPESYISRQEAALILSRVKSLQATAKPLTCSDAITVAAWSKDAVRAVLDAKLMAGYPDGRFKPNQNIKRSEALVAIQNSLSYNAVVTTVYDKAGTFGPATGSATIEGNVIIKAPGITLQNTVIKGNLTIAKEVGTGDVTLKKVTVNGNTFVNGGGVNSLYFIDVTTGKVYVLKDDGPVRIVASGSSTIENILASSAVKLEEVNMTGKGFEGITVEKTAAGGIEITLVGVKCDTVDIQAKGVTLKADKSSSIATLTIDGEGTQIQGAGTISKAVVNQPGVTFETKPADLAIAPGIKTPVIAPITPVAPPSGGGGNSGGNDSNTPQIVYATAPLSIHLTKVSDEHQVTITDVAIPAPGSIDRTGFIRFPNIDDSMMSSITKVSRSAPRFLAPLIQHLFADGPTFPDDPDGKYINFKFTVIDAASATSTIKIDGVDYVSGATYDATIDPSQKSSLQIDVHTTEPGKTTAVRTFIVGFDFNGAFDHSSISTTISNKTPTLGTPFDVVLTHGRDKDNVLLSGEKTVKITSDVLTQGTNGVLFNGPVTFTAGSATIPLTINDMSAPTLTFEVEGITYPWTSSPLQTVKVSGDWKYHINNSQIGIIMKYTGSQTDITLPLTLDGQPISIVGENSFWQNATIEKLTVPDGFTAIDSYAFYYCYKLKEVILADTIQVIGSGAFNMCTTLSKIDLGEGLTTVESNAFYNCYNLSNITFPRTVTSLGATVMNPNNIRAVIFEGNAPTVDGGYPPFGEYGHGVVYFNPGATGFTTPIWHGSLAEERATGPVGANFNALSWTPAFVGVDGNTIEYSLNGGVTWSSCASATASFKGQDYTKLNATDNVKVRLIAAPNVVQDIDIKPAAPVPNFTVDFQNETVSGLNPDTFYHYGSNASSGVQKTTPEGILENISFSSNISPEKFIYLYEVGLYSEYSATKAIYDNQMAPITDIQIYDLSKTYNEPVTLNVGDGIRLGANITSAGQANTHMSWSVVSGTGLAHITPQGYLRGLTAGTITVKATATDGSGVSKELEINIQQAN